MKRFIALAALACLMVSSNTLFAASETKNSKSFIDKIVSENLVRDAYLSRTKKTSFEGLVQKASHRCEDDDGGSSGDRSECVNVACDKLGTFGCDHADELRKVGQACRGVSGDCLKSACNKLGSFGCDQMDEIEKVAPVCRGNHSNCLEQACNLLGTFGCDQADEIGKVGKACRGVRGNCIKAACDRLGTFGCDQIDEIEQVAASCRGE